jgi:Domain of unknown function (DUF4203)
MLPASYQMPAALVLLVGGIVACFFGYRLFRIVLAIFGFILGALVASSLFGTSDTAWMLGAALLGGLVGMGLLTAAYFVGVALLGASLGALFANVVVPLVWHDPHFLVVVVCALAGAIASMYLQRYVIIFGTGFGGAWTLIVGTLALIGNRAAMSAAMTGDVWVLYPLNPAPGLQWVKYAWVILGIIGAAVQLGWTGGEKGRVRRKKKKS